MFLLFLTEYPDREVEGWSSPCILPSLLKDAGQRTGVCRALLAMTLIYIILSNRRDNLAAK
ncbi:MAG: hypothetical protein ACLPVI_00585, partial [Dehalococcoidales bacterium]